VALIHALAHSMARINGALQRAWPEAARSCAFGKVSEPALRHAASS